VLSKLQLYVQGVHCKQQYRALRGRVSVNKGLWAHHGPRYLKVSNKGFAGFGVKAFMKERPTNGFEFIENAGALEARLFSHVESCSDAHAPAVESNTGSTRPPLFSFFKSQVDGETILAKRDQYIRLVKQAGPFSAGDQKEIMQAKCVLMKAFYQAKGTLVLTADQLMFVYIDEPRPPTAPELDVRD